MFNPLAVVTRKAPESWAEEEKPWTVLQEQRATHRSSSEMLQEIYPLIRLSSHLLNVHRVPTLCWAGLLAPAFPAGHALLVGVTGKKKKKGNCG